jgi:alpha-D-xyloside xylohydrolase
LYFDSLKIEALSGASVEVKEKGSRVIISDDTAVLKVI